MTNIELKLALTLASVAHFKTSPELLNLRALNKTLNKTRIFQCMGEIFCIEVQRIPLKFHTKYITHTLKDMILHNFNLRSRMCFWNACLLPQNISTHWGRDKIEAILQTTFSNAISWMKMFEFRLKFQWSLFLKVQLKIFQHCFR